MGAMIRVALLILPAWLAICGAAVAQGASVELSASRSFGYFAGDIVRLEAVIATAPDAPLSDASLPRPRAIRPWLDLRDVAVEEIAASDTGARRYRLSLDYQLLDAPMEAAERTIPPVTLKIESPGGLTDVVVPARTLLMSPLRGANPGPPAGLMPDAMPVAANLATRIWVSVSAGLGVLASIVLLAHHHARWPFRQRAARPFTATWREIRYRIATGQGEARYRESLLALHRAFDQAAGQRLFASGLDAFLDTHPQFRSARHDIGQFFVASRQAFFAEDAAGASDGHPIEAVCALSRRLSRLERRDA